MRLFAELWLPISPDELFPFFSEAANLEALTPPWLHFQILTPQPIVMRAGTRIGYRIRLHGIPITWETDITLWNPPHQFVDTQRRGPYRRWVHTHTFTPDRGGTTMTDEVQFEVPLNWLVGRFVAADVRRVFEYRHAAMMERFSQPRPWPPARITLT